MKRAKRERAWKSPHARKARRGGEREKWGTTDKFQAFNLLTSFFSTPAALALLAWQHCNWLGFLPYRRLGPDSKILLIPLTSNVSLYWSSFYFASLLASTLHSLFIFNLVTTEHAIEITYLNLEIVKCLTLCLVWLSLEFCFNFFY